MAAVLLPLVCFALLLARELRSERDRDARMAFLRAAVWWGVALLVGTESLSLYGLLTPRSLALYWLVATGLVTGLVVRRGASDATAAHEHAAEAALPLLVALGAPIGIVALVTGLLALCGWPNQWDTLVYHLPRVDHWIQDRGVGFYPTHILRQLASPPWAEYAALHLVGLSGHERAANLVQWFSMIGSTIGVSVIARDLGAARRGQAVAALAVATIPMGILQSSTMQNDYVEAFWLVCVTVLMLSLARKGDGAPFGHVVCGGAALGLALATKGTGYVLVPPLLLLPLAARHCRTWARFVGRGALLLAVAVVVNLPHYARNVGTFGFPLGPRHLGSAIEADDRLTNETFGPGILVSNALRNVALHLALPWPVFDEFLARAVRVSHEALGLDVTDPRSTRLYPLERFELPGPVNDPARTGNPLHLVLIAASGAMLLLSSTARRRPFVVPYTCALALSFVLFSALLKWQPWHSRLQLPLFVLGSTLVGLAFERRTRALLLVAAALAALALPPLFTNVLRPVWGPSSVLRATRIEQYFPHRAFLRGDYVAAAERVRALGCRQVGLLLGWDDFEHPLWALLDGNTKGGARLEHVGVDNASGKLAAGYPPFVPCALVGVTHVVDGDVRIAGRGYVVDWIGERTIVLVPDQPPVSRGVGPQRQTDCERSISTRPLVVPAGDSTSSTCAVTSQYESPDAWSMGTTDATSRPPDPDCVATLQRGDAPWS